MQDEALEREWEAILARGREVRRRAQIYAAAGKPAGFLTLEGRKVFVSPDLDTPGQWRVTTFGTDGQPWGHYCVNNAFEAFREVLNGHATPTGRNHPAGD